MRFLPMQKTKAQNQLYSNCGADQYLRFCYTDSTIPLLSKYKISSFWSSSVLVQLSLCRTCLETLKRDTIVLLTDYLSVIIVWDIKYALSYILTNIFNR